MDLNFKSRRNKNKNKLMKKINFFQFNEDIYKDDTLFY